MGDSSLAKSKTWTRFRAHASVSCPQHAASVDMMHHAAASAAWQLKDLRNAAMALLVTGYLRHADHRSGCDDAWSRIGSALDEILASGDYASLPVAEIREAIAHSTPSVKG